MHTLFLLNPTAGKADCTRTLPQQIAAAAAGAGLAPEDYTIRVTTHAGHARELSRAAAAAAQKAGVELRIFTAGGDGTFNEALTGAHGFDKTAVGCLPYGSGNDFLRTYGTKEEFLDLDALGAAIAHRAHQAVHGQHLAVNDVLHPALTLSTAAQNRSACGQQMAAGRSLPPWTASVLPASRCRYRCSRWQAVCCCRLPAYQRFTAKKAGVK